MAGIEKAIVIPFEIELSGKIYKAGMPNLEDLAIIRQAAKKACEGERAIHKAQMIKDAKTLYGEKIPPEVFSKITAPISEEELEDWQGTPDGMALLLYRCLMKHDSSLTLQTVKEAIKTVDFIKLAKQLKGDEPKNVPEPKASQ